VQVWSTSEGASIDKELVLIISHRAVIVYNANRARNVDPNRGIGPS